jgi:tetratricopeptide (TPR) repeat protein
MKTLWLTMALLLPTAVAHAQPTPLPEISTLRDRAALERVVREYEGIVHARANDPQALKALGIAYHNLGAQRVGGAVEQALRYLDLARAARPGDAEILAYFGSARTMVARDSWNPVTKMSAVRDGMRLIDAAVSRDPDNITVRLVRAGNSLRLPKIFDRRSYAKEDYEHVLTLRAARPLPPTLVAEVHFRLGEIYHDEGAERQAREHWTKAMSAAPGSEWAKEANKRL